MFEQRDTNNNGVLSYAEFSETRVAKRADDARQAFDEIDTNGNGSVTQAELRAAISGGLGR